MTKVKKLSQNPARGRGLKKRSRNLGTLVPRNPKTPTTCVQTSGKKMRRVASVVHPSTAAFGFDVSENLSIVSTERGILSNTSSLLNTIMGSDCSRPNYKHPFCLFQTDGYKGMYMPIQMLDNSDSSAKEDTPMLIGEFHTIHTQSLFCLANRLLERIPCQPQVKFRGAERSAKKNGQEIFQFKTVYTERALTPGGESVDAVQSSVLTNCQHMGANVVLKKAKSIRDQQRTVLEALIHLYVEQKHPGFVPKLHFIAFTAENALVVCSEQVSSPSVYDFVTKMLPETEQSKNRALQTMVSSVCRALVTVQKSNFTHRDLHTSNVFYDHHNDKITLIDFDWSCISIAGKNVSVPRFLYDTTRKSYGCNKSVDMCIFIRNLVKVIMTNGDLRRLSFFKTTLLTIMKNYQSECKLMLCRKFASEKEKDAAFQLYRSSTYDATVHTEYKHRYALQRLGDDAVEFEYRQGYFEWKSMVPENIKNFIETGHFLPGRDFR
jgi:tRNA A-37 threonylcarbamoyl transferase component Bud32